MKFFKNTKLNAWTLAEMTIAITILIVMSAVFITKIKPANQKNKIFVYAAIKNLQIGNLAILDASSDGLIVKNKTISSTEYDGYCVMLADSFGLSQAMKCKTNENADEPNLRLPNGIEYYGIANGWTKIEGTDYSYKDILVDINGATGTRRGKNQLGVDQFPLRVIAGGDFDGHVYPVDCSVSDSEKEKFYKTSTGDDYVELNKSIYCNGVTGTALGSPASTHNYTADNQDPKIPQIILYDVVKNVKVSSSNDDENSNDAYMVKKIAAGRSFKTADCMAYGGYGYFSVKQCQEAGIRINPYCVTTENCTTCNSATCPDKNTAGGGISETPTTCSALVNEDEEQCSILLHKPSSGASLMIDAIISDIDIY